MRVATRLNLAVLPAVLGLALVAALAYWGERGRQAPGLVVAVAVVAALASLASSWRNTRYVAHRVEQLAGGAASARAARATAGGDELEEIASTVSRLSAAVAAERAQADARVARVEAHLAEQQEVFARTVRELGTRAREVQLPLHILLDSPFGALNENQEELVGAARDAAAAAEQELGLLDRLLDADRAPRQGRPESIGVRALLDPPLAIARARAEAVPARLAAALPDALPRVVVEPGAVQEALTALLAAAVARARPGADVMIAAREPAPGRVAIDLAPGPAPDDRSLFVLLARRTLEREGAAVAVHADRWTIELPAERPHGSASDDRRHQGVGPA